MALGANGHLPFHYRKTAGNIADVTALRKAMGEASCLDVGKTRFCMDWGFCSKANIDALMSAHMKFAIGAKVGLSFVRSAIDENADAAVSWENYDPEQMRYVMRAPITWKHEERRARLKTVEKSGKRAYLHLSFSPKRRSEETESLHATLALLHCELAAGSRIDAHEGLYDKYFAKQGRGWVADEQAIADKLAYSGWFAMLANDALLTCTDIDRLYSDKDRIEKAFGNVRERHGARVVGGNARRQAVLHVRRADPDVLAEGDEQESGLADDYTLDSMLDEVEAVEMFEHEGRKPALGEITAKQRNIFEKMKVELPALSQ